MLLDKLQVHRRFKEESNWDCVAHQGPADCNLQPEPRFFPRASGGETQQGSSEKQKTTLSLSHR